MNQDHINAALPLSPKVFHALTEAGLEVLKAEVARLSRDVSLARSIPALGAG